MANLNVNKVIYGGDVLIDLTGDTVSIGRTCNGCNDKGLPKLFSGKKCVFAT